MFDMLRPLVLRILRVPPEPQPPAGAPGSLRVFRAARGFLWITLLRWLGGQAATLVGLVFAVGLFHGFSNGQIGPRNFDLGGWTSWIYLFEAFGVLVFLLQLPVTLVITVFDYQLRWYLVTDRSLRIRSGIWTVDELTMTYANVQELTIHQGPVQRLLGISDLKVRSAGGGTVQKEGQAVRETHAAYFHGVDNAEAIRDLILMHLRGRRDAGLGDPDELTAGLPVGVGAEGHPADANAGMEGGDAEVMAAAQALLGEARALRAALR